MKIKVVHVIDGLGWAGMEQMVASLVCRIDKSKFEVTLLSELPMKDSVKEQADLLRDNGVNVYFLQKSEKKKFLVFDYYRIFRKINPQIVHSHSGAGRDSCLAAILAGVPCRFHTEHGKVFLTNTFREKTTNRLLSRLRHKTIAVSDDLNIFLSNYLKESKNKIITIHNGIDTNKFHPLQAERISKKELGVSDKELLIIAVGRINPVKDYETLIKAAAELKNAIKEKCMFKFLIVGPETIDAYSDEGTLPHLRDLVVRLRIKENIIFLGKRNDIPELLALSDIFVQTSISEGLSMSILEAMCSALPVVATDVGGNKEVIEHGKTGYLAESKDYKGIARNLTSLLVNEQLREKMASESRERVLKHFSSEQMTKKYEKLYMSSIHA